MKVIRVTVEGHPVLRDFELDFRDSSGNAASNVILAGENGVGKSVILDLIANLSSLTFVRKKQSLKTRFHLHFDREELDQLFKDAVEYMKETKSLSSQHAQIQLQDIKPIVVLGNNGRRGGEWDQFELQFIKISGEPFPIRGDYFSRPAAKSFFRTIYSSAEINFEHQAIKHVTTEDIDRVSEGPIRSAGNLATQITQLLVDIQALDDSAVANWVRENPSKAPPAEVMDIRMSRFKRAFSFMFPRKRYVGVLNSSGGKEVQFSEDTRQMSINNLSSGEKQIVFRGSFLLKDRSSLRKAVVLIDEPEISLHPNWQMKIIEFYRKIFEDNNFSQGAQLIFATHSPFVIHSSVDEKIIILEKDQNGSPRVSNTPEYPSFSRSAAIEKAFNFEDIFPRLSLKTIVLVEGPTDEIILKAAWSKLRKRESPFEIVNSFCASYIRTLLSRDEIYEKYPDKKFIGLFDFDEAFNEWNGLKWKKIEEDDTKGLSKRHANGKGISFLLPIPVSREGFASVNLGSNSTLSIEFMFEDHDIPGKFIAYRDIAQGGKQAYIITSRKMEFAKLTENFVADQFKNFEPLFTALEAQADDTLSND